MTSRCIFVCCYFICFFSINRWFDLYQFYFHWSTKTALSNQIVSINQLNVKQLQHVLNLRGISYADINEKSDLIKMIEQTGEHFFFCGIYQNISKMKIRNDIFYIHVLK